ncbi:MAG: translation initiation factor IF-2 [Sphingomonadales bacterium]
MSETKDQDGEKLSLSGRKTLHLRKVVERGQVRQSFSHGRTKSVVVERKRKRVHGKDAPSAVAPTTRPESDRAPESTAAAPARKEVAAPKRVKPRVVLKTLTEDEKAVRARALKGAAEAAHIARERATEEARRRAEEEARLANERAAADRRRAEEEARKKAEEEARKRAEDEAARRLATDTKNESAAQPAGPSRSPAKTTADATARRPSRPSRPAASATPSRSQPAAPTNRAPVHGRPKRGGGARDAAGGRGTGAKRGGESAQRRRGGKMTVVQALDGREERQRSLASMRRARAREKQAAAGLHEPPKKLYREVVIPDFITVQELASRMTERAKDVIRALMGMGVMATVNQSIGADTAELIVTEFGHRPKRVSEADVEIGLEGDADQEKELKPRPPVVTVMGHVDHGKTSLLDALRASDVAAREAGGITQHIGAYQVEGAAGRKITFIDTPGHAAFTAMRARGAGVTDLVVLVVAADDGIMPQTIEAIDHAKAAEVPIIVAINKMDKTGANADRVRQELLQHDVVVEELGGDVLTVEVSAIKKTNLDKLEEAILLQAELLELKANPDRRAEGVVVEAKLDKGRGVVATLMVQRGTAKIGDILVAGAEWGKVRALLDDRGERIKQAGPSQPVEVLGLTGAPVAGDAFAVVDSESRAREVTLFRQRQQKTKAGVGGQPVSLENMFNQLQEKERKELPVVIKADTQGSAEAIVGALEKMGTEEVSVRVLHGGVGAITESDVTLCHSSEAVMLGFNIRATKQGRDLANSSGVEIRYYSVIYELVDEVKAALSGMLAPTIKETAVGAAEILEVFSVSKIGKVAGCIVTEGLVRKGARARLLRDRVVVHEGQISGVRRFKDEVKEVNAGTECGIAFEKFQDLKAGDSIEVFEVEEVARTL